MGLKPAKGLAIGRSVMYGTLFSFLWVLLFQVVTHKMGWGDFDIVVAFASYLLGMALLTVTRALSQRLRDGGPLATSATSWAVMLTGVFLGYLVLPLSAGSGSLMWCLIVLLAVGNFVMGWLLWGSDFEQQRTDRQHFWHYSMGMMAAQVLSLCGFELFRSRAYQDADIASGVVVALLVATLVYGVRGIAQGAANAAEHIHKEREQKEIERVKKYNLDITI